VKHQDLANTTDELIPAEISDELAALAMDDRANEVVHGGTIGTRAGILKYNGQTIPGNRLDVVVLNSAHENRYYEGKYDADDLASPVCFALSASGSDMAPHPSSSAPQSDSCTTCPKNQWGSAAQGKGKACKNTRRLALIPASALESDTAILSSEIAILRPPVTSVKRWANYLSEVYALTRLPALGVITTIYTEPDEVSQFRLCMKLAGVVPKERLSTLLRRRALVDDVLMRPYEAHVESTKVEKF